MKRNVEIIIDGVSVDTFNDTAITLNFESSLLADVGSLHCNGSQTVSLPRTPKNDKVFELALSPSYESGKTHKSLSCRCFVDGVTIFDNGRCHLLDSNGDQYSVAMTWGLLQEYDEWLDAKKKLTELENNAEDSIAWDATWGVSVWQGGASKIEDGDGYSMYALYYDNGVNDRNLVNIHPSVTLQEVWERLVSENDLNFNLGAVYNDLRNYAIVLNNNNTSLQTIVQPLVLQAKSPNIAGYYYEAKKKLMMDFGNADYFDVISSSFVQQGYRQVTITIKDIYLSMIYAQSGAGASSFANNKFNLVVKYGNSIQRIPSQKVNDRTIVFHGGTYTINQYEGEEYQGEKILEIYVELYKWSDDLPQQVWEEPNAKYITGVYDGWANYSLRDSLRFVKDNTDLTSLNDPISYTYENNSNDYPLADFSLVPNLPDISQIDFVNFICRFYGLGATVNNNRIDFVRLDVLSENIEKGQFVDWSDKLFESYLNTPKNIAYTYGNYAQHNEIKYKEDKNDEVEASATIDIDDVTLERGKVLFEFPFAASRGDVIPQYQLSESGELEKKDLEFRLMRIIWNGRKSKLNFDESMNPKRLINSHYKVLQDLLRKPKVIEEEIRLNLIDLQQLDYTKPVYLDKYGRHFAIISVRWSSDKASSQVKLLKLN